MGNPIFKIGKDTLLKGGAFVAKQMAPDILNLGARIGNDILEKQKNLVRIPDLKDVHIEDALRILKDELNLIPTQAIANPSVAYADESENEVMYSEPKFGSRVDPKTTVKVYYLTQEVIDKSKELLGTKVQEFGIPRVVGLNIYEAREDLEELGLRVATKTEKPDLKYISMEDGQVTRITYPNNQKIGSKLKTGERVWLYYVSEEVILESQAMKMQKEKEDQERIESIKNAANAVTNSIYTGVVENAQRVADIIGKPMVKNKVSQDNHED